MVHHYTDIFLCAMIETAPFREETAYEFMVSLCGSFLVRTSRIAVKDPRPLPPVTAVFQSDWIGELGTVVRQTYPEHLTEKIMSDRLIKKIEDVDNGS